ncbi:complement receptor type 1 isoform X2 [Xenopus laevis]|uniref:Complement receptor type 1 isoform X2 n=1 Tax=Xenopus laevis TaxID=8355 RepID=A0A8J0UDI5_XENLA|nr:complement receptor type 1 isoform X2 [Xenopus laevis]
MNFFRMNFPVYIRNYWAILFYLATHITGTFGECGPPPTLPHTEPFDDISFPVDESVVYSCNKTAGYYEIPGRSRTITCQDDFTWSTVPEFCIRACESPPRLEFAQLGQGDIDKNIYLNGTTVKYECRPGFIKIPLISRTITCLDNFTWTAPESFCRRRTCGNPGEIENGDFEPTDSGFQFGSSVTYKCHEGYRMISKKNTKFCQADGKWTSAFPKCEVMICTAPRDLIDGLYKPKKEEYSYQEAVTYVCNNNLALIGNRSAYCTTDGTWSSEAPVCKDVKCPEPKVPNAIKISGFQGPYHINSAVSFKCNEGFMMNGSESITCNVENKWDPPLPECLRFCTLPSLEFSKLKEEYSSRKHFFVGTTLEYDCLPGYRLSPKTQATITCRETFQWSPLKPSCEPIVCEHTGKFSNGRINSQGPYKYNTRVTIICDEGYTTKTSYLECQRDGKWSNYPPVCEEIECEHPEKFNNGRIDTQGPYKYKTRVNFICDKGYTSKTSYLECQTDGTWSNYPPECEEQSMSVGAIVGIIVFAVILVIVASAIIYKVCKKSGNYNTQQTKLKMQHYPLKGLENNQIHPQETKG